MFRINTAQVSMEFIVVAGFIFMMSLGFIVAAGTQMKDFSDSHKVDTIKDFGNSIQSELELASVVKEGYKREITLPDKIELGIDYNITITNSTLIVMTDIFDYVRIVPQVNGNIAKGKNTITKNNSMVTIENG